MQAFWYFDFISPFAYLQLPKILALRERVAITPVPILFAAVLDELGQLGPAEIPAKRLFTYRLVHWQADREGVPLCFPPAHPFNPLPALRLCMATNNRWDAVHAIFAHLWHHGRSGDTTATLAEVAQALGIADINAACATAAVKNGLRANTAEALRVGVFGVPTLRLGDELFWGNDATAMAELYLDDPAHFDTPEYRRLANLPKAIERRR